MTEEARRVSGRSGRAGTGRETPSVAAMLRAALERHRAGDSASAERLYRQILALDPGHDAALHLLGAVAFERGDTEGAIGLIRKAIEIAPANAVYHNDLGSALQRIGEIDAAIESYRRGAELKPDLAACHFNLANALSHTNRHAEAAISYRAAVALEPGNARWHDRLGRALRLSGDIAGARIAFERSLDLDPQFIDAITDIAAVHWTAGDPETSASYYRRALSIDPAMPHVHSDLIYLLAYTGIETPAGILAECRRWEERHAAGLAAAAPPHDNDPDPGRRLRIGYVSPDFRLHAVANFIEPVIEAHDRRQFEIYCYAQVRRSDRRTERLRKLADHWRPIVGCDDDAVAAWIRADRIDVLVDLAGHTGDNRLLVFARRPAPVQVTWLGYMGTTGLSAMDYIIANRWLIPPEHRRYFAETVFDVPHCAPFRFPAAPAPRETPVPERREIVFGCFNNSRKVREVSIEAWCRILARVPGSRMILKSWGFEDADIRNVFLQRFARHGIDAGRIELRGGSGYRLYLDGYRDIDIALDSFPANGGTTTCDTLLMGVPLVTLWGDTMAARVGGGTLCALGLDELVTDDVGAYVELAVELASDRARLDRLRRAIGEAVVAGGFTDMATSTRGIEAAFREMWRRWCEGRRGA